MSQASDFLKDFDRARRGEPTTTVLGQAAHIVVKAKQTTIETFPDYLVYLRRLPDDQALFGITTLLNINRSSIWDNPANIELYMKFVNNYIDVLREAGWGE